ncbi:MAG: DNA internalization-related competence protein ComEC/Rec2 [Clostridia bacterium]|nr:DNA internalization-related competence protein ComEC/Rec2 [Clostridia bacterium]
MARISTYAIIPYILVCLTFGTGYSDLILMSVGIFTTINILRRKRIRISVILTVFTVAAYLNCINTCYVSHNPICGLAGKEITLKCVVDDMPSIDSKYINFTAKAVSAEIDGETVFLDGKVSVYTGTSVAIPKYGDLMEFETRIKLPYGKMNDGGFDYRNYLNSKGIIAVCNAKDNSIKNHGKYENVNYLLYSVNSLRTDLAAKCDAYMSKEAASFAKAFVLGYKGDMSEDTKNNLADAGLSHIVAVSGLHLSIMITIINLLISKLKSKRRVYIIPAINIVCSVFIAAFTGFSPSVIRAALMLIISNSAALVRRENDSLQSLSFALLIILLINPMAVHDVGLVLSASATLGIILLSKRIRSKLGHGRKFRFIRETLAVTLSAQIFTLPVMVIYFNSFSLYSAIINILIVPMLPYLMVLILLFLICPIIPVCQFLANGIWLWVSFILKVSEFTASIPFARVCIGFAKFSYIIILLFCAAWFIRKTVSTVSAKRNILYLAVSCISVILILFQPTGKDVKITAINTGYADCTLIQLPKGRTMLIDSGKTVPSESSERIIIPYLLQNGVHRIDYAVISKFTSNNVDGMMSMAEDFDVGCIIVPRYIPSENESQANKIFDFCRENDIPLYMMDEGNTFSPSPGVNITVHSPKNGYTYDANNGSLVFKLSAYGKSVLFTGDIDNRSRGVLAEFNPDIESDILKIPRHGSSSKADEEFLTATNPKIAYIFTSNNDQYIKQRENTLELLSEKGIVTFETNIKGTLKFTIKPDGNIYTD